MTLALSCLFQLPVPDPGLDVPNERVGIKRCNYIPETITEEGRQY